VKNSWAQPYRRGSAPVRCLTGGLPSTRDGASRADASTARATHPGYHTDTSSCCATFAGSYGEKSSSAHGRPAVHCATDPSVVILRRTRSAPPRSPRAWATFALIPPVARAEHDPRRREPLRPTTSACKHFPQASWTASVLSWRAHRSRKLFGPARSAGGQFRGTPHLGRSARESSAVAFCSPSSELFWLQARWSWLSAFSKRNWPNWPYFVRDKREVSFGLLV